MKILYMLGEYYRQKKMDRERIKYGEAVERHPDVELKWWGNGYPDHNDKASVAANLARLEFKPDIIWVHKPQEYVDFKGCGVPSFMNLNEVSRPEILAEISDHNITMVIHHHENDRPELEKVAAAGRVFVHSLHGADEQTFLCTRPIAGREVACLSSGMTCAEFYPLRQRYSVMIKNGKLPGVVRPHPGYRLGDWDACEKQFKRYGDVLGNSKIVISCSSIWKYPLSKYTEAMAAGAVVVGDMPNDSAFKATLGRHLVEVSPEQSNDELAAVVTDLLADPGRMQDISTAGRETYRNGHTNAHYADRLIEAIDGLLRGLP